jgi:hypothetical protein
MRCTDDFYIENSQALKPVHYVLRESIAPLAVQLLVQKYDIKTMSYGQILDYLKEIIEDLQKTYEDQNY